MARITIQGKEYNLFLGLGAMEHIEEEYGSMKEGLQKFREEHRISVVRHFFWAMANNGRLKDGKPQDVTKEETSTFTLADLDRIAVALREALDESTKVEVTGGGEADDEEQDALAAEYDQKNG